jgi:hypothetical protein
VPLLCFVLLPFPIGCGLIYPIRDVLRGHPAGTHGSQPQKFVGLWIRDETVEFDFLGQAFYLMPDGRLAGLTGMTERRWHFDNNCLFVDSVSRCGNCYSGNVTTEHTISFSGEGKMFVTNKNKAAKRGIAGNYRRAEITGDLKAEMSRLSRSANDDESFRARMVLRAVEMFEGLSKLER